jgi:hypothetical protein
MILQPVLQPGIQQQQPCNILCKTLAQALQDQHQQQQQNIAIDQNDNNSSSSSSSPSHKVQPPAPEANVVLQVLQPVLERLPQLSVGVVKVRCRAVVVTCRCHQKDNSICNTGSCPYKTGGKN